MNEVGAVTGDAFDFFGDDLGLWYLIMRVSAGGPSHFRPVRVHFRHAGRVSSHLILRILAQVCQLSVVNRSDRTCR